MTGRARGAAAGACPAGSRTRIVSPPPGVSAAVTEPPIASTKPLTTARPRPTPLPARAPSRSNGSNIRAFSSPGHAVAVVDDLQHDLVAVRVASRAGGRPGGEQASALANRLASTRSSSPGSVRTSGSSSGTDSCTAGAAVQAAQGHRRDLVDRRRPQERLQRAGGQPAHVEQVADQRVQPVGGLLDGGQQRGLDRAAVHCTSVCRSVLTLALIDGQRRAQVVADRGEQRGAHPVALGQGLGLRGLGAQPVPVQRGGGLRGEPVEQPRAVIGRVLPGDLQQRQPGPRAR